MILRELRLEDEAAFEKMLDEWNDSSGFNMMYGLIEEMSFPFYLKLMEEQKSSSNEIPVTGLYAFVENEIVGKVSVRHRLNLHFEKVGGHVGYGVLGKHRGRGYASLMLKDTLVYCRSLNLERVLLTCDETNEASLKVIRKNGGVLDGFYDPRDGTAKKLKFWIEIQK